MKEKVFGICIFIITVGFVITNSALLSRSIGEILSLAESIDTSAQDAYENVDMIYAEFKSRETFLGLTVNHEDMTNIEECLSEMKGQLCIGAREDAEVTKSRLVDALRHLRRLCGVNIDAII